MVKNNISCAEKRKYKVSLSSVCWFIIIPSVLLDFLSGFFSLQVGVDLKISLLYKSILIVLCMIVIMRANFVSFIFLISFLYYILFVSYFKFLFFGKDALTYEMTIGLKFFSIILFTLFFIELKNTGRSSFNKNAYLCLNLGFWVVVINVLSGYLGFGFSTYASSQVGFKGYFFAGNELSALFIVLSSFKLQTILNFRTKKVYFIYSILVVLIGFSIGTKSGIVFSVLLPFALLVISQRKKIFTSKFIIFFLVVISLIALGVVNLVDSLSSIPAIGKIIYNFSNGGLLRLIFSGRDVWVTQLFEHFNDSNGWAISFFGYGSTFVDKSIGKYLLEIDPIDVYNLYGVLAVIVMVVFSICTLAYSIKNLNNPFGAAALVVNFSLLIFAFIAGHVWTSGMLSISWSLLIAMSTIPNANNINVVGALDEHPCRK
ncbi:hypothetical protein EGC82_16330 [Shewanella livingstonensis]|uniref:O-antigen ligase domain-containing protein n=1 Tax=Shewanella livingstonensis TaxID=150120 RepID=A0A3G8LZK3_9GAMM|nr:O-antigen ligase family protein [Shewanella livingstonensis]AZG74180.1 hypothetical protein EGC82_16330 [Shewanella livingstonensis]